MSQTLRAHLIAMREGARAISASAEALLAALEPSPPAPSPSGCTHPPPMRREAARMGRPSAWICSVCGEEGD